MMNQYGFSYRTAGENIERTEDRKFGDERMDEFQGHRANILGSGYTKLGVGWRRRFRRTAYWVQMFAG